MSLEEEVAQELRRTTEGLAPFVEATVSGTGGQELDAATVVATMVIPVMRSHHNLIIRLAREIDELRKTTD